MRNLVLVAAIILFGAAASAAGKCESKSGTGVFCEGKNKSSCEFFADSCDWNEAQEIVIKIEQSESSKSCTAKDGKEAHESFCSDHDKAICKVHSSLCEWK